VLGEIASSEFNLLYCDLCRKRKLSKIGEEYGVVGMI
jgi:hypothetical protein